jgi:hypothetical protein
VTRLVQLARDGDRRVALVDGPRLVLLAPDESGYVLARRAIVTDTPLPALAARQATGDALD